MDQVSSDDELREEYTQYSESSDSSEETPVHVHDAFNQANANTLGNYSNVIKELGFVGNKNFIDEDSSSDKGAASRERSVETSHAQFDEFSTMSTQAPESFQPYLDLQPARTKQKTKKPIPKPRKRNKQPTQAAQVERKLGSEACVVSGNNLVTMVGNNEHSYSSKLYESKNVLVTGLSENTSADTLLYYMERMAEKDVEKVRFLGQGRAVVTTKEPLEFDRLAMKVGSRPLDDRQLSVERINLCDSMLVSNLPAQVTKDSVLLYFENVRRSGGGNVKDVNYSKEKHCAIVVFEEYQVVDDVISREHNLEGKLVAVEKYYPQISSQTITNSNSTDSVSYLHDTPKLETRETHKRPQETQARQEETQARQQETQERKQETQERQQETQERPQETQERPEETRDDMSDRSMTNIEIDNDIMQFIMSGPHANKLEGKVDGLKAEIQWERENETVTIIKKVHSGYVKRWEKNCRDAVTEFFDQFEKFLIPLSETIVAVIDDVLPRLLGNGLRGKAFCKSDEDRKNLVVVCLEDQRHDVCQSIESFLEIVEKEEIRKAYEKETIEDISHERMQFLQHIEFVEEIQDKNPELEIKLDLEQHMIYLEGPREQVRNCKKEYSRVMDAVTEESFTLPSAAIQDIVTSQRGVRYFKEKLALQNITAMFFKEHKTIKIVAKSVSDYQNAKTCLLESFYREEVSVNVENAFIFKTDDCQDLITGLNNNELVKISVESSGSRKSVVICGIVEVVVDVKNDIENIIERERIQSNSFEVPKTARRFLSQHCMDKLKDIEERLKTSYVSIRIDQALIQMKGTRKGLEECADRFFQLCDTIVTKNEKFSSPGLGKLMFGEKGRRNVKLIEMERKVIIDITKTANPETAYRVRSEVESIQKDEKQTPAASKEQVPNLGEKEHLYDLCNFTTKEGIKVSWKYGYLEDETADILVNSANPVISNLTLCGKALSNVGGQQFIEACKAHSNVVAGEIACTSSGGNLACKNVIHAVCCDWDNSGNAETLLHGLVKKILAKSIQLNATSVALPTIGTGQHKFSEKVVFEVYRKEVEDFSAANPQTCLKDVQIIVFKGKKSSANPAPSPSPSPAPAQLPSPAGPAPAVASPQVSTGCVYDICNFTTNNGIKVTWKYGNIEKESASVLVNSATSDLNSLTACGKALNAVGGPTFIQACTSHNSIGEGNIACTVGGNLQCQNVLHAVCCDWKKGKGEKILRSLLSKILTQCKKLGATSLAIPIIGTAGHKFREQFVLQVYKEEIEKFSANNSSQLLLKDIRVIVFSAKQPKTQSVVSSLPSASPPQGGRSRVVTFGQVQVSLHEGDITQQATPSDGLINLLPTDLKLKNGGGVCTSILNSGGTAIQTQLDASGNQPLGSIIRTGPGLIKNYKQILNVIPTSNNVPGLQNAVERCLNEAKTQAMGSVSIPAIGTAGFNINPRDSAELILNAVKNFSSVNYALVVNIVVFQKGMVPQFEAKIHEKASGNAVQAPAVPQPQAAAPPQSAPPQPAAILPQAAAPPTQAAVPTATVASNNPNGNTNSSQPQETDYKTLKTGQTAEVILVNIVASSKKSADESLLDMEKFIKENIGVARIKHQKLVDILSKNWPKIQGLARDNEVNINCASAMDVEIRGCRVEKVSECKDKVQCLIDEYDDEERKVKLVDQHKSVCKIISKTVQWSYMQTNQSVNYNKELNTIIEIAFSAQENKGCQVSKNGDNYEIDFNAMTEKNIKTGQVVQISRKLLGDNSSSNSSGIQLPPNWTAQPQGKKVHLVPLVKTSAEYLQIQNLFISTGGTTNASQVYSIERVQNPGLYQAYAIKKQTMGSTHNEMRLFHGTNANNSHSISINNFNRSYAGINGVALGVGVYFAKQAGTSLGYSKRGSNANGYFQMFVGKVLVGTCAKGSNGMKNPPPKNDPNNPGLLHDSTVDNPQNPSVFVVFLDHQCYPEYLITFK